MTTRRKLAGTVQRVALKDIQPGPIRHLTLPPTLVTRIQGLSEALKGFYDPPGGIAGWLEGFQRDMNPESEVVIWEAIAKAVTEFMEGREPLPPEGRKDLMGLSLTNGDFSCKHLSFADAQAFLGILRKAWAKR